MKIVNLMDKNFPHQKYSSKFGESFFMQWDRSCSQSGPTVFTDKFLNDRIYSYEGEKIAWLLEPLAIQPEIYVWIRNNWKEFNEIWTYDTEILNFVPNALWVPAGGTWIQKQDRKLYLKKKLCSFIASNKNWAPGHKLRQEVRSKIPSWIDQFGKGFNEIDNKVDGLKDYMFSIVIENCHQNIYFTEKILDCFLTGTIPIYWGTKHINEHFNCSGILFFQTTEELNYILNMISENRYKELIPITIENFKNAFKWLCIEDYAIKMR